MSESSVYFVTDSDTLDTILYHQVEQRYAEGHTVCAFHVDELQQELETQKNNGRNIAVIIYDQVRQDEHCLNALQISSRIFPTTKRILLANLDQQQNGVDSFNREIIDHLIMKPVEQIAQRLFPIIDELIADWRTQVEQPYVLVSNIMTVRVIRIHENVTLHRAAEVAALSGVGDLMVVDDNRDFVGVLSVGDILRAAMPDIDEITKEGGSLTESFQLFLRKANELSYKPIKPLIIREPITVDPDDHVAKVATVLLDKNIGLLPVVRDNKLIGTVSRADICQAVVGVL